MQDINIIFKGLHSIYYIIMLDFIMHSQIISEYCYFLEKYTYKCQYNEKTIPLPISSKYSKYDYTIILAKPSIFSKHVIR